MREWNQAIDCRLAYSLYSFVVKWDWELALAICNSRDWFDELFGWMMPQRRGVVSIISSLSNVCRRVEEDLEIGYPKHIYQRVTQHLKLEAHVLWVCLGFRRSLVWRATVDCSFGCLCLGVPRDGLMGDKFYLILLTYLIRSRPTLMENCRKFRKSATKHICKSFRYANTPLFMAWYWGRTCQISINQKVNLKHMQHTIFWQVLALLFSAVGGHPRGAGGVFPPRIQWQAARGASQRSL